MSPIRWLVCRGVRDRRGHEEPPLPLPAPNVLTMLWLVILLDHRYESNCVYCGWWLATSQGSKRCGFLLPQRLLHLLPDAHIEIDRVPASARSQPQLHQSYPRIKDRAQALIRVSLMKPLQQPLELTVCAPCDFFQL